MNDSGLTFLCRPCFHHQGTAIHKAPYLFVKKLLSNILEVVNLNISVLKNWLTQR